jgi:class 3 adenylate cyclase
VSPTGTGGWARSNELYIAYEIRGSGPIDLVEVPGILSTIAASAYNRRLARFEDELARFSRHIKLDKRGTGLSDRLSAGAAPTVEDRIDDVRAVMDAVRSARASLYGTGDGAQLAIVFAATYPERVSSLVLSATGPGWPPWTSTPRFEDYLRDIPRRWGHGFLADAYRATSDDDVLEIAQLERLAGTPTAIENHLRVAAATDVQGILSAVSAPTLVIHYTEHPVWPIEGARLIAERIPNARLIELPGQPEIVGADSSTMDRARIIEEFVTGQRAEPDIDRVLKTILFTDIVESTEHAVRLGDRRWRALLEEHDELIRAELDRYRGQEVKTTGDGFLAAFDGPARSIRCARAIVEGSRRLGVRVRAGVHTGECELRGTDLAGIAVHVAARVTAAAGVDEVLVTSTVRDLVAGSGIEFTERDHRKLKGVPGDWLLLEARTD